MSVEVTYTTNITVNETIDTNVPAVAAAKAVITHDQYNTNQSLTPGGTVPVTQAVSFSQALTAGAATIDLTALVGVNNLAVDGTGLKVQAIKFKNPAGNASMKIDVGATNGYPLAGAGFETTLLAGQEVVFFGNEAAPDISASAKTFDLTGTGTQAGEFTIVMG